LIVIASVAISIAILVLTPNKLPASEVFGTITDGSGWNNKGLSFLIGYLSVAWTMTDYDATAHMSEEVKNAAISGPVAIFQAVLITWVFGFLLNVALGFCAGNVTDILASPMGNPAAQVFFNAAGRSGGLAMWVWPIIVQFFTGMLSSVVLAFRFSFPDAKAGITAMLSDTRTAYALARDGALPLSGYVFTRSIL
jgi:amino acid transporter